MPHKQKPRRAANSGADDEALVRVVRRAMVSNHPDTAATMKRFGAAAAMLIAGKPGRDMVAPEPIVQVGFEPDEGEMAVMVEAARDEGRDLIHVSCHEDGSGKPTGMIAVVYFEDGKARPHRRCGLVCEPAGSDVVLGGVSDDEDEPCRFVWHPGGKMSRVAGWPAEDLGAALNLAGERWFEAAESPELGNCDRERLVVAPSLPNNGK